MLLFIALITVIPLCFWAASLYSPATEEKWRLKDVEYWQKTEQRLDEMRRDDMRKTIATMKAEGRNVRVHEDWLK